MASTSSLAFFAVIIAIAAIAVRYIPRASIGKHLSNHQVYVKDDLIPPNMSIALLDMMREIGEIPSNLKVAGMLPVHEHIGEGVPIGPDGTCSHKFLMPNSLKTLCILPERVDVAKHYVMTGGLDGKKEDYKKLIARVSSFGKYTFAANLASQYPLVKSLFDREEFQTAAKTVCPKDSGVLDPFQFTFVVQVPGQTVAAHLDCPAFWGATRFQFPQWLLVAMEFSNLFAGYFINQIQVVGYIHQWKPKPGQNIGGEFVYYANSSYVGTVQPNPNSGTIVDGSKTIHAAKVYRPDVLAPTLDKDKETSIKYIGNVQWAIVANGERIKVYEEEELRISLVYRARCFRSEADIERFAHFPPEEMMELEDILNTFKVDLVRNHGQKMETLNTMNRLDFALLIVDTYSKYPLPPMELAWIPYNLCAIPMLVPSLAPIFQLFC